MTLTSCGATASSQAPSPSATATVRFKIATADKPGPVFMAAWAGALQGQVNSDGTACLWLGNGPDRKALIWPAGYSAAGPPLTVYNEISQPVAVVGKGTELGGGNYLYPLPAPIIGCPDFDRAWIVGSVKQAP